MVRLYAVNEKSDKSSEDVLTMITNAEMNQQIGLFKRAAKDESFLNYSVVKCPYERRKPKYGTNAAPPSVSVPVTVSSKPVKPVVVDQAPKVALANKTVTVAPSKSVLSFFGSGKSTGDAINVDTDKKCDEENKAPVEKKLPTVEKKLSDAKPARKVTPVKSSKRKSIDNEDDEDIVFLGKDSLASKNPKETKSSKTNTRVNGDDESDTEKNVGGKCKVVNDSDEDDAPIATTGKKKTVEVDDEADVALSNRHNLHKKRSKKVVDAEDKKEDDTEEIAYLLFLLFLDLSLVK